MSTTSAVTTITYTGDYAFEDEFEPVPGKSEWGMDTLTRVMAGGQPNLVAFMEGLSQGQSYTFNGNVYYLQTWQPDGGQVYPRVTMNYLGLVGGIPAPKASGGMIEQTISLSASETVTPSRSECTNRPPGTSAISRVSP